MPDYQKGKIYKLWSDESDMFYIGSTTSPLHKRLWGHKNDMEHGKNTTVIKMREHSNIQIELVENFPCNSKDELRAREGYYIRLHKDKLLNKRIAGRTQKDWIVENKDLIAKNNKERYVANKEIRLQKCAEYRESHREQSKEYFKKRYDENKEEILRKLKESRRRNKELNDK